MKTKNVILTTLLIPVIFVIIWYGLKLRSLPDHGKTTPYISENFSVYGEDGTFLPGEIKIPATSGNRAFLISADQKLDRNWNSRNMDFQTGKIISHILASNGIPAAIYDQRGSGKSVMSGRNHPTPENLTSDLHIIYEHLTKNNAFEGKNLEIIAHGHGCIPALLAVNNYKIPVKRIYLLSCVFPETLLDSWIRKILNNMVRAGVSDVTMSAAENITEEWKKQTVIRLLKDGETNEIKNKDQDIQSLYRALDYLQSEEMHAWTVEAKSISFLDEINKLDGSVEVLHILNEYDEEFAENLVKSWDKIIADGLLKREKNKYIYKTIPNTDHFFMEATSRSSGVIRLVLQRINPFREMDRNLFEYLLNPGS